MSANPRLLMIAVDAAQRVSGLLQAPREARACYAWSSRCAAISDASIRSKKTFLARPLQTRISVVRRHASDRPTPDMHVDRAARDSQTNAPSFRSEILNTTKTASPVAASRIVDSADAVPNSPSSTDRKMRTGMVTVRPT